MNDYKMRVKAIQEAVQGSERYKSVINGIALSKNNESSPQTKKHLIKSLKPFTGQSQNKDKSSHGWIDEAYVLLADLKDRITQEKELYKQFNMAYRRVYEVHRGNELQKELDRATVTKTSILQDDVYKSLLENDNNDDSDF